MIYRLKNFVRGSALHTSAEVIQVVREQYSDDYNQYKETMLTKKNLFGIEYYNKNKAGNR